MTSQDNHLIDQAARLLRRSRYAIALTGAGISTPSGIPDFRSPDTGLWESVDPMKVASIYTFRRHPESFFEWIRPLTRLLLKAEPNPAHRALARLEAQDILRAVITQNVDGLHQRAGSSEVLEIHGHMRSATCMDCYRSEPTEDLVEALLSSEDVPRCPECGGVLKPDVVLFGEQLPIQVVNAAVAHVESADLMLVAGSFLEVTPVSRLPMKIHRRGGRLIVVNLSPTHADSVADVVIRGDVADVLPKIAAACAS